MEGGGGDNTSCLATVDLSSTHLITFADVNENLFLLVSPGLQTEPWGTCKEKVAAVPVACVGMETSLIHMPS